MKQLLVGLLMAAAVALPLAAAIDKPVKVEGGLVAGIPGTQDKSISVFKGIPFAAPPVGDLRWRAPQPVVAWQGVKQAVNFSDSCVQTLTPGHAGFGPWTWEFLTQNHVSEDCLYLNVWTPARSAGERHPVFLYIYGGAFTSGSAEVPIYDGEGLARKSLLVVTVNYRVGVLGFFAHPDLTKESGQNTSGNYGLLDQLAALRWIQKNIAKFGGDPRRVTIAGQSAGAISVHYLTASPLAKGLFQRAIAESGGSSLTSRSGVPVMVPKKLAEAEADGVKFAHEKGASSLGELRAMSWQELMKPVPGSGPGMAALFRFAPIVDGYFAPESPLDAMLDGKLNDVPTLTGCNAGEITGSLLGPASPVKAAEFREQSARKYGDKANEFLKLYPAATDDEATRARSGSSRDESLVGMYLWARRREATMKTSIYIYLWDHTLPGPESAKWGAFHTSEVPYVMNTLYMSDRPFTDKDRKIAEMMSSYWANFVAAGDPNGNGLPDWPAVNGKPEVMEVGDRTAPVPLASDPAKVAFFEDYLSR